MLAEALAFAAQQTKAFHAECIMTWCVHRGQQVIECPMCRQRHPFTAQADVRDHVLLKRQFLKDQLIL